MLLFGSNNRGLLGGDLGGAREGSRGLEDSTKGIMGQGALPHLKEVDCGVEVDQEGGEARSMAN